MTKNITILIFFLLFCNKIRAQDEKTGIQRIFNRMELQGIDTHQKMNYEYYFLHSDKVNLEKVQAELEKQGYTFIALAKTEQNKYRLHLLKVEAHSVASLTLRCTNFHEFEQKYNINSYDGWEVSSLTGALTSPKQYLEFISKKDNTALFEHAIQIYDAEMYENAIVSFTKCMEKSLKIDTCLYKRGNCLQELKQTDAALRDWVACIAKNKNYYSAYYNSACTYDAMLQTVQDRATPDLKITQKAMDLYEKCTKMRPTDDRAFYGMASMFFIQNKKTESMIFCNKALALNPDNTNAQALMQMLK